MFFHLMLTFFFEDKNSLSSKKHVLSGPQILVHERSSWILVWSMVYALSVQEFYLYLFIELDVLSNLNLPDLIVVVRVE